MFVCKNCGALFEEPQYWEERHGLDHGPFETFSGCPRCSEPYVEAYKCDGCGEFITDTYVKTENDERYCSNCYMVMSLGEEDF